MADITCCTGEGCPHREHCYRFTAPKNPFWQSFFCEVPLGAEDKCDYFWPLEEEES